MKTIAGLWIDHRKANVVILSDKGENTCQILSNVDKQLRRTNGQPSTDAFEPLLVKADDRQLRKNTQHLKEFYEKVLSCIGSAESVMIFGPGEAKKEFRKLMKKQDRHNREVVMKSMDKMTDNQISAEILNYRSNIKMKL